MMKLLNDLLEAILLLLPLTTVVTTAAHIGADDGVYRQMHSNIRHLKSKYNNELLIGSFPKAPKAKLPRAKAQKAPKAPKVPKAPKGSKAKRQPKATKLPKAPKKDRGPPSNSPPMAFPSPSPNRLPTPSPSSSPSASASASALPSIGENLTTNPSATRSQIPSRSNQSSVSPSMVPSLVPSMIPSRSDDDSQLEEIPNGTATNLDSPQNGMFGTPSLVGARAKASDANDALAMNSLHENFLLFSNISGPNNHKHARERSLSSQIPMFICDNDSSLLCDASELSSMTAMWSVRHFQAVRSTDGVTAYSLYIRNSETGRYFTSEFGQAIVDMVENESLASFWTLEYGKDEMVVIHPGNYYDMALCMKNDGTGYYYKVGLGYELPTKNILDLGDNCLFPMAKE